MYLANKYSSIDITTSHSNKGISDVGGEISQDLFNVLNIQYSPLDIHNSPIQTQFKNPFRNIITWVLNEEEIVNGKVKIKGKGEIYGPVRDITRIWKEAREMFFPQNSSEKDEARIAKILQPINTAYAIAKQVFEGKSRNIPNKLGMYLKYFEHLKGAALNAIYLSHDEKNKHKTPEIYVERIVIAFLHDIMEDINISFDSLKDFFGERVALGVLAISKKPWVDYINQEDPTERYLKSEYIIGRLDDDEENIQRLKKKYKSIIAHEYFSHLKDWNTFKYHISILAQKNNVRFKDEKDLETLVNNALIAKFSDRIDNLRTEWNPEDLEKVKRKVEETKKYFLPIAQETRSDAYELMIKEIHILEEKLAKSNYSTES